MRNPIECLRVEHSSVRRALGILHRIAAHVAAGRPFPAGDCALTLRFLRDFVDGVHGRKEGDLVLPALAIYGDEEAVLRAGSILRLHEEARELLQALVIFWEPVDDLTDQERDGFVRAARAYGLCMERAMTIEDEWLPLATERWVPADDRLGWDEAFRHIEQRRSSLARWLPHLDFLSARWH